MKYIFWELLYCSSNRHYLDVMHIENNVFANVFNTIMDIKGKTKDNEKTREDMKKLCRRHELENDEATRKFSKVCYTLDKARKQVLCEWVKILKFPDRYVSNMGRCVDMRWLKLFGMKSQDCHVFMQRLLLIAFHGLFPTNVWQTLIELNLFFKDLTSTIITVTNIERLERDILIIICKLEHIFPHSLFDSMEHLLIHLPYEARIATPV